MNKTIKKLICFILALSFLGGMHFVDTAKASGILVNYWFSDSQYVGV